MMEFVYLVVGYFVGLTSGIVAYHIWINYAIAKTLKEQNEMGVRK